MRTYILTIVYAVVLGACTHKKTAPPIAPTDTIPTMVMQIQKCSKLYTAEYRVHKIVTHDDRMKLNGSFMKKDFSIDLPLGSRKIAIPMDATLKAYIDFSGFDKKNIRKHGQKIEIILPDPKVTLTSTRINHEEIKQYVALTRSKFTDEELTNYEQQGRQAIINTIPSMGIIDMARESAARTLIPMIQQMGYKEEDITVSFRKQYSINDIRTLLDKTTIEHGNKTP